VQTLALLEEDLERTYIAFNKRPEVVRDPVRFLYSYARQADIELAGIVASSLAYGRVAQINKSVSHVLDATREAVLGECAYRDLTRILRGFVHRFTVGDEVASLLVASRKMANEHGSLCAGFLAHFDPADETVLPALKGFVRELYSLAPSAFGSLIPMPDRGSALKRLNLFLRWMVRKDEIDPGPWDAIPASKLIVPLDVHMHRIGLRLGFTTRKQADMKTAIEVTRGFRRICPEDPTKYDFCLTHSSIAGEL
jgi:uncharacterized protein (TIGR02757 family)